MQYATVGSKTAVQAFLTLLQIIVGFTFHDLRKPAIHGAKTTKNQTPLVCFAWLFYNQTVFQKFERSFFDQVVIDAKNV